MDDNWAKKYHQGLGLFMHREGQPVVFNPWFGIYARFLACLDHRWRPLWDAGEFDLSDLKREMRVLLPTPEAWRQAQIEMEVREVHLRNLQRMSVEELTDYLETLKHIDPALLNLGILNRIVARRGKTGGLPSALKEVLAPDIEGIAVVRLSSEYVYRYGSLGRLVYWGGKGIAKGLKHLGECPDLNVVDFLFEHIEESIREGYDSIMHPKWAKGPKDLIDHRKKLVPWDKPVQIDPTVHPEREDEERSDSYVVTVKDRKGTTDWDDELRAYMMLERAMGHLTDEKRKLFFGVFLGDVSPIELSAGEQREYNRLRQEISRTGRFVKGVLREGEMPEKRPRGRPPKKDKAS